MARVNQVVGFVQNADGTQIYSVGTDAFTFDPAKASAKNRAYAEQYGFRQRIQDKAAMSRNPETGEAASPREKFLAMKAMAEHYEAGGEEWNLRTGRVGDPRKVLAKLSVDEIEAYLAELKGAQS